VITNAPGRSTALETSEGLILIKLAAASEPNGSEVSRSKENHYVLAAPVWTQDDRIAFVFSVIGWDPSIAPKKSKTALTHLLECAQRASLMLAGTSASGPRAESGAHPAF
jgi:hypothetical protein